MKRSDPDDKGHRFCYKCGHFWFSSSDSYPKRCPRCHSSRWDVPVMRDRTCKFCGHSWQISDSEEPCPQCGRKQTDSASERMLHCNQCDYDWARKRETLPKRCPLCHSPKWREPKVRMLMCRRCNHVWSSQTPDPKRCPNCQSIRWNDDLRTVECQRCGHSWILRGEKEPKFCPACKSNKWKESPKAYECPKCGRVIILRSEDSVGRCPYCDREGRRTMKCPICGNVWTDSIGTSRCPRCYNLMPLDDRSTTMAVWADSRYRLEYVSRDGFGFLYLWDGTVPVATAYMHDICKRFGMTVEQLVHSSSDGSMDDGWRELKDEMVAKENSYVVYINYFKMRLSLSYEDARILAIHFTGMGPEAIAIKFGMDLESVKESFDRIMSAYTDNGIVVDDTIFTENPFMYYGGGK